MTKGRFSFSFRELAQTFGPGKPEDREDGDYDYDWSPPPSPYPGKPTSLPPRLEADLKMACAAIVMNTIPSDYRDNARNEPPEPSSEHGDPTERKAPKEAKERKTRERSSSNKFIRNFSLPAPASTNPTDQDSEVPDFPLPSASIDRSRYGHKADMALSALFGLASRSSNNSLRQTVSKRKSEAISIVEGTARTSTGRPSSKSFSVVTNLPFFSSTGRPKTIRRTVSDDNANAPGNTNAQNPWDKARPLSMGVVASKRAKHASYHATTQTDPELEVVKAEVRVRERRSWYKLWTGDKTKPMDSRERAQLEQRSKMIQAQREKTLQELRGRADHEPEEEASQSMLEPREEDEEIQALPEVHIQPDIKRRSRAATYPRGNADESYLDQLRRSRDASRDGSKSPSSRSRRSSASSGVIPLRQSRFSWKNVRKSWASWRDASEDEDGTKRRSIIDKRKSNGSLRNRKSTNIPRDMQPLPIIDQNHGDEADIDQIPEEFPPMPIANNHNAADQDIEEQANQQSSISSDRHFTAQAKQPPLDLVPTSDEQPIPAENLEAAPSGLSPLPSAETVAQPSSQSTASSAAATTGAELSKSGTISASQSVKAEQNSSPVTPRVKPSPKPIQIRPPSKRSSIIIRNQTDPARAKEHRKSVDLMTAVQMSKASEARRTLELHRQLEALRHVETRPSPPAATPRRNIEFRKSLDFKKSVEFWKSIEKRSTPDFRKKAEYRRSCSDIKALGPLNTKAGLQYQNSVSSKHSTSQEMPDQTDLPPASMQKSTTDPKLTPTDSVMDDRDPQGRISETSKNSETAATRTPPNGPLPSPPPGSVDALPMSPDAMPMSPDALPMSPSSISSSRKQRPLSWLPPQQDIPDISKKRISRTDLELQMNGPAAAVPGRLFERPRSIASSSFRSLDRADSTEAYNTLQSAKYQYADDIVSLGSPPTSPKQTPNKKKRWPFLAGKQKKPMTWMDEMENLGIKDGMLMVDQLNGPPIVRY